MLRVRGEASAMFQFFWCRLICLWMYNFSVVVFRRSYYEGSS